MITWQSDTPCIIPPVTPAGWMRIVMRAVPIAVMIYGGVAMLLLVRAFERLACHGQRRFSVLVPRCVARGVLWVMGISYQRVGTPMHHRGAVVANHASWLDIFTLNAGQSVFFVSKAEVAAWPGIGFLARVAGTLFIHRDPKQAQRQQQAMEERFHAGDRLLFFPEGTSSDGLRVLPFKSTLFQAFFSVSLRPMMWVQPVTVIYQAPSGQDPRFYGWWGDMGFGPHLLAVLSARRGGGVRVVFHPPLQVSRYASRKDLAAACEHAVRSARPEAAH